MSNIFNTPNPFDHSERQNMIISAIERDRRGSVLIIYKELRLYSDRLLHASLLQLLDKKTTALINSFKVKQGLLEKELLIALATIKKLLEKLQEKDLSTKLKFSKELSDAWHILLSANEELSRYKKPPTYFGSLTLFINAIKSYPKQAEHSLGYYLTEYTGETWIPFPYMDLLRALHEEALINRFDCTLQKWHLKATSLRNSLIQ